MGTYQSNISAVAVSGAGTSGNATESI